MVTTAFLQAENPFSPDRISKAALSLGLSSGSTRSSYLIRIWRSGVSDGVIQPEMPVSLISRYRQGDVIYSSFVICSMRQDHLPVNLSLTLRINALSIVSMVPSFALDLTLNKLLSYRTRRLKRAFSFFDNPRIGSTHPLSCEFLISGFSVCYNSIRDKVFCQV